MIPDLNEFFRAINPSNSWQVGSKEKLMDVLEYEIFSNNDYIIKKNRPVEKFYWVNKGAARHFFDLPNGNERIIDIYLPGDFFTDHESHLSNGIATTSIKAIGKTECFSINIDKICHLYVDVPEFAGFVMMLLVRLNKQSLSRIKMLLALNQHDRYEYIKENQSDIFLHVPLKYIAQYIGVAPESLSRLRRQHKK